MANNSQLVGGELVGYFTSLAEDLISGLSRTNPADGHGTDLNSGLRMTSPSLLPLSYGNEINNSKKKNS